MKTLCAVIAAILGIASSHAQTEQPVLTQPAPPQLMDLIPTFPVSNMDQALNYYTKSLGFFLVLQSGNNYAAVGRDFVQIGLGLRGGGSTKGPKSSVYINMNNVESLYKELKGRGVKMSSELKTQPSKMKEFAITDPDGNIITFGEYVGPK